jgi:hypothetical protein
MKTLLHVSLLCLTVWLGGCASSRVVVDKDPAADLSKYRTFQFTDVDSHKDVRENPLYHSSLIDRNIHAHIAAELMARGMEETDTAADMLVAYHTYTERKRSSINEYYPMMYGGWYWRFRPWGMYPYPYAARQTYSYTEGTLIIDLIDARTKLLVWRGSVAGVVDDPAELQRQVKQAVDLIFKKYPVPANYNHEKQDRIIARQR